PCEPDAMPPIHGNTCSSPTWFLTPRLHSSLPPSPHLSLPLPCLPLGLVRRPGLPPCRRMRPTQQEGCRPLVRVPHLPPPGRKRQRRHLPPVWCVALLPCRLPLLCPVCSWIQWTSA